MIFAIELQQPPGAPLRVPLLTPARAGAGEAIDLRGAPAGALLLEPGPVGVVVEAGWAGISAAGRPLAIGGRRLLRPGARVEVGGAAIVILAASEAPPGLTETRLAAGAIIRAGGDSAARLVVTEGPEAGHSLRLGPEQTLGRGRAADLRISDPGASRLHVRVSLVRGGFVATDLRSKNGLRVNGGRRRARRRLEFGDELEIGTTRMMLAPGLADTASAGAGRWGPVAPTPAPRRQPDSARTAVSLLSGAAALLAAAALLLGFL